MVKVGIETDRGAWVAALVARYRERHSTSGAKSDCADAHLLAEIVRLDRAHHRPGARDTDQAEAIKLPARTHQSLIWDRTLPLIVNSDLASGTPLRQSSPQTQDHG